MSNIVITQALGQAIHDYLMARPMGEVEHLVAGLRAAQPEVMAAPKRRVRSDERAKTP